MSRFFFALLVLAFGLGTVLAADEVKVELKDFKWKCKFEGGENLGGFDEGENRFFFYAHGSATGDVTIPEDGEYKLTIDASCTEAMKEFAKFKLSVGDVVVAKEHACTAEDQKKYEFTAKLKKGKHPLVIEYLNDVFKEGEYDRNLFVYSVKIEKK
jgi:Ca-dependent carbohydrate-binding module xylan-binding